MGRKRINLVGQKFGRLVVKEFAGKDKWKQILWLCICECGNEIIVRSGLLKNGHTKSCGCLSKERFIDLTGQVFGRLVVKAFAGKDKSENALFLCSCECGNEIIVKAFNLKNGNTRSCGCLQREISSQKVIPEEEHEIRKKDKQFRRTKEYKKLQDEIWAKYKSRCFICEKPLKRSIGCGKSGEVAHLHSLKELNYDLERFHKKDNLMLLCRKCHYHFDALKGEHRCSGPNAMKSQPMK
jgi:5-methylcytosine-specific restriction endonuclease McrA